MCSTDVIYIFKLGLVESMGLDPVETRLNVFEKPGSHKKMETQSLGPSPLGMWLLRNPTDERKAA